MSIKTEQENPTGLHLRYLIRKVNGEPIDPRAEYFALRLDLNGDPIHVAACRKAVLCYADEIESHNAELAADIRSQYGVDYISMKAKVEELLEANLAQHDEWNGLMNAYHELDTYYEALLAGIKKGTRVYVELGAEGEVIVPYVVPTDKEPNATIVMDADLTPTGESCQNTEVR